MQNDNQPEIIRPTQGLDGSANEPAKDESGSIPVQNEVTTNTQPDDVDNNIPSISSPIMTDSDQGITWQADEFVHHKKTLAWYVLAGVVSLLVALVVYLVNRDYITSGIVFVSILGLAYFSSRHPRSQQFMLDSSGVQIGSKYYSLAEFQSFSIITETPTTRSILLVPLKRFMPLVTINLPPEYEESAAAIIGQSLPMQPRKQGMIDSFLRQVHF